MVEISQVKREVKKDPTFVSVMGAGLLALVGSSAALSPVLLGLGMANDSGAFPYIPQIGSMVLAALVILSVLLALFGKFKQSDKLLWASFAVAVGPIVLLTAVSFIVLGYGILFASVSGGFKYGF